MDTLDFEQVKQFIRENIEIDTEFESKYSSGNNVIVGLKLKGDDNFFTKATIYIPDAFD